MLKPRRLSDSEIAAIQHDAPREYHFAISNFFRNAPLDSDNALVSYAQTEVEARSLGGVVAVLLFRGVQRMLEPAALRPSGPSPQIELL